MDKDLKKEKEAVAMSSVLAGLTLTGAKFIVGLLTNSIGIISEAIHSLLDFASAIMTFFAVRFGDKPADDSHPYGHGKIESVSALITTGLLFFTSIWIIYEATHRLIYGGVEVEVAWYAFAVVILSIIIDISRSRALMKVAKATNSQALEADALHFTSDIWSSVVVLLGLILTLFGVKGADSFAAIGVALFVANAGYHLGKRTIDVLIDAAPEGVVDSIRSVTSDIEGVIEVSRIRVRPLGPNIFIDLLVSIDRKFSAIKSQEVVKEIERRIKEIIPQSDIVVHTQAVQLSDETIVESVQVLAAKKNLLIHSVVVDRLGEKKYISYHLELPEDLSMKEAHLIATELEDSIREGFGDESIELNSHIEPLKNNSTLSEKADQKDIDSILSMMNSLDGEIEEIKNLHNILIRKIDGGFFISFHCICSSELDLETVHDATNRFEYLIKERIKEVRRVVIHVEPEEEKYLG
ncbi:MAG: cation diffusion facilitator family transporter [Candidatus Pacebacteria bacterium]|nr:cation diffusion facilitator family transporter [Candidatus Paceibacterota bacterium]